MSVRRITTKKTKDKPRVSKTQQKIINQNAFGDEPRWREGQVPTTVEKAHAFNWYATMAVEGARAYLVDYFVRRGETETAAKLSTVPNTSFPRTPAWLARMEELGADVKTSEDFIRRSVAEVISRYAVCEEPADPVAEIKKVQPADAKFNAFVANIEEIIDKRDWTFNVYDALKGNTFPTSKVSAVADFYIPLLDEIRVAIANTDHQVYEGYRKTPKRELKRQEEWLVTLVDDCRKYGKSEKAVRAPRKKTINIEKKLKNFEFLRESNEFKAGSVDPATIIGAKKVYLFNVKYKIMIVLVGESLDVKGKSIVGFGDGSWTAPMGRRAAEAVTAVTQGNEAAITRKLDELRKGKDDRRVKNSVDRNTLILRVVSR